MEVTELKLVVSGCFRRVEECRQKRFEFLLNTLSRNGFTFDPQKGNCFVSGLIMNACANLNVLRTAMLIKDKRQ